jgi:hypothetical protein
MKLIYRPRVCPRGLFLANTALSAVEGQSKGIERSRNAFYMKYKGQINIRIPLYALKYLFLFIFYRPNPWYYEKPDWASAPCYPYFLPATVL